MDYKKRLKIRKIAGIILALIGVAFIIAAVLTQKELLSTYGAVFFAIGIARVVKLHRIAKNEELSRKMEIAETDERNIKIWTEARSLAFAVYIILAAVAIMVCSLLDMRTVVNVVSYCLFGFAAVYWICYFFVRRKY